MDIAVIGSNNVDLITYIDRMPAQGETLEAPDFQMGCGGKGANQAVAAARLGSEVLMLSRVGNDIFAENTLNNFKCNGIDTTYVLPTEATSGVAPIFVDRDSNNSILIIKGANDLLTPADIEDAAEDIAKCKLIVLQLEIPLETVYAAIDFGNEHGIPVLLNPAPAHPDLDIERVKGATYFMPNETELALLTGLPVESLDEVKAAAQVLLDKGVQDVIVTLGSRGALWINGERETLIPAIEVKARDTTGAGDAFIGCFSHYLVATGDVEKSLTIAARYAADSVTKLGTQTSYATREEFEAGEG
ncbi:MAG: ribokinase [Ancrocorticia sp.]